MPIEIRMPEVAADVTEADLLAWLVEPGQRVEVGDVLLEIETDKAVVEIESPGAGVLSEILVHAGTRGVAAGALLGHIDGEAEAGEGEGEGGEAEVAEAEVAEAAQAPSAIATPKAAADTVSITALARRMADESGLDLASLEGTGARGRITKKDVERRMAEPGAARHEASSVAPSSDSASERRRPTSNERPHSRMRRTIARRLSEAKQTIPHFYLTTRCEIDRLVEARRQLNESGSGPRISLNDFVIRAAALALREVPDANASWDEDALRMHESVDISVAVATDGGLITPVIRDADRKGLAAISSEMRELAGRARQGKLQPNEYRDGTFSVSNLGMYGIDSVLPIINPPEACILGVGAARREPVVRDDELAVGTLLTLTLSADHRVVDGAIGATLLAAIQRRLERPLDMAL